MHDATHPVDLRRNGLLLKATMLLLMCTVVVVHVHAAAVENVDPVVVSSSLTLAKLDACHGHHCNNRRFSSSSRRNTAQSGEQYNKDDDGDGSIGSPSSFTPRKRVCQLGSPHKVTSLDSVSFSYGTAVIPPKNKKKKEGPSSSRVLVLPEIVTILSVTSSSSSSSSSAAPSVNHQQQQQRDPPCEEALPVWLQRRMAARRSELAELYHLSAVLHITLNNSSVGIAYEDCMDTKSKNSSSSSSSDVLPSKIQNNAATAAASDASMQDASWVCDSSIEDTLGLYHSLVAEKVMLTNIEVVCMVRSNSDGDGDEEAEEAAGSNWGRWLLDHHHHRRNATSCYLEYDTAHRPPVGGDLGLVVLFLWATLVMSLLWYLVASPSYHKRVASERLLKKFDDLQEWVSDREGRLRDAREGNGSSCSEGVSRAIPSVPIEQTATVMKMDSVTTTAPHQRRVRKAAAAYNNNNNNHNSGSKNNDDDDNEHVSMLFHNPEKLTLRQMLYRQESNPTQLQSAGRGSDYNSNNNNNNNSTSATTSDEVDESLRRHHRRGRDARRHADMYDDDESLIMTYPIDGPL